MPESEEDEEKSIPKGQDKKTEAFSGIGFRLLRVTRTMRVDRTPYLGFKSSKCNELRIPASKMRSGRVSKESIAYISVFTLVSTMTEASALAQLGFLKFLKLTVTFSNLGIVLGSSDALGSLNRRSLCVFKSREYVPICPLIPSAAASNSTIEMSKPKNVNASFPSAGNML